MKKALLTLAAALSLNATAQTQPLPYQNPALTAETRADDLLGRLTLEEKAKLMMDVSPAIARLGIPAFQWWNEALHGIGRNGFATMFPITTMMAASWDDALLYQVFNAVSDEARAKNQQAKRSGHIARYQGLSFWTPNINIFRDPRWGRGQETYGEDPYLTERMGLAVVNGLQGQTFDGKPSKERYSKLLACAKHFAVHSGPEWNRHTFDIQQLPERDLWETYLPAFKALVQKGNVAEVMCAYQRIDGQPCCGNTRYEQQILRDEWGFQGLITSDCGAIRDFLPGFHSVSADNPAAAAKAVASGTDVECGSVYRNLPEAVQRGDISEERINTSLRRLLVARFRLGDFDADSLVSWTKIPESVIASTEHKLLSLQMAREGTVLLKNDGILPLKKADAARLVVMGPNANDSIMMWGNYSGYPTQTITILQGLRQQLGDVRYVQGCGLTRGEIYESRFDRIKAPLGNKGMQAIYWNNTEMEGEPVTTVTLTTPLNLSNGGNTVFAPGVNLEQFSARYDGNFIAEKDETLTLRIGADDKVRVMVNGDTLVNIWKVRHRIQEAAPQIQVKAGQHYRIQIDYVQESGMAAMQFDICKKYTPTDAEILAQVGDAETVVFVGGISPRVEGEEMKVSDPGFKGGDRTDINLPAVQRHILALLHKAGKRVVFINCSGGAMALAEEEPLCAAIVQGWYGGERGGQAMAEILTGAVNPSGKLPITFYRSTDDLPDFLDYRMTGRTYRYFKGTPLYPFGYGLSYTTFEVGQPQYKKGTVMVTVKNTGATDGTEVVQVYLRRTADTEGPIKTLRAYSRVSLEAGESRTVKIALPRERFEGWDEKSNTMRIVPGRYELMVGTSSADRDLKTITINMK